MNSVFHKNEIISLFSDLTNLRSNELKFWYQVAKQIRI